MYENLLDHHISSVSICPEGKQFDAFLPVDAGALDAESDAQVDAGPTWVRLATVTAAGVARNGQDLLQGALAFQ